MPFARIVRRRRLRNAALLGALAVLALNVVAWRQARALTHFAPDGQPLDALADATLPELVWVALAGAQIPRPRNALTTDALALPFETRSIALPQGEQLEAWWMPQPHARGLAAMFPGYAAPKETLLTPAAHMQQFGYSTLLVDFRGAGGSSRDDTTLGMREAEDVRATVAYIQQHWPGQPIILYGNSMGSAAIFRAVATGGVQPDAIIAEAPFDRLLTTARHRFAAVGVPSFPAAELLLLWGSLQIGANGFANNPAEYAAAVTCPTLLLQGEADLWIRPEETKAVFAQLRGPKQLATFPNVAHQLPYAVYAPERWDAVVRPFLDQLP